MKEVRFIDIDSLLKKQFSPLHTQPVILVSDVLGETLHVFQYVACSNCEGHIYNQSYRFCPHCGHLLKVP